ncbi:MAG: formate dehydrogenase accessory protein FdhE [Betaproteobacteria bacterium]|nr:formate dehydrogenase accessory protein FdhE [Betaproteobacteria bacterium]
MSTVMQYHSPIPSTGEPPRVIAPVRATIFSGRARRFNALAEGHALGDWLRLLGRLTLAQHQALQDLQALPLPDATALERARYHGMPPVPAQHWSRDPAWRAALRGIIAALKTADVPDAVRQSCIRLDAATDAQIEALAERVLRTELYGEDAALLPFVAAALQVYWAALAAALGAENIPALGVSGVCPCCGSLPVASMVRFTAEVSNLRYLHCSLCSTEWNLVRVKCAACDATGKISYRQIEGSEGSGLMNAEAMRAETCDNCMSYLKILYQEKAPEGDPVADDLATLALDMLVDAAGYSRAGPNLLFVPGAG